MYSTENYIQYPVRNYNGKEYLKKKVYIYIYIYTHTHTHTHTYIYVCITESLFYTAEINTTL